MPFPIPSHRGAVLCMCLECAIAYWVHWDTQRENLHMANFLSRRSKGQSLMEYALLFVLIALVVMVILIFLGPQLASQYKIISNAL